MAGELAPTVDGIPAPDLEAYRKALLRRFGSPRPAHRLAQIAEDGSQKIPIRLLEPLRERLARTQPSDGLILVVASWLRFHEMIAQGVLPGPLKDPLAERLLAVVGLKRLSDRVRALDSVFDDGLAANDGFLTRLDAWQVRLAGNRIPSLLVDFGHGG
jgi:fructuronate reductase